MLGIGEEGEAGRRTLLIGLKYSDDKKETRRETERERERERNEKEEAGPDPAKQWTAAKQRKAQTEQHYGSRTKQRSKPASRDGLSRQRPMTTTRLSPPLGSAAEPARKDGAGWMSKMSCTACRISRG